MTARNGDAGLYYNKITEEEEDITYAGETAVIQISILAHGPRRSKRMSSHDQASEISLARQSFTYAETTSNVSEYLDDNVKQY